MTKGIFMNKTILYTLALALLSAGCTTKEQDEQIQAFWQAQIAEVRGFSVSSQVQNPVDFSAISEKMEEEAETQDVPPSAGENPNDVSAEEFMVVDSTTKSQQPNAPAPDSAKKAQPFRVFLFTHTDSPLCKQLKQEHWDTDFQQKYKGTIELVEYDMINPDNRIPLRSLMRRYQMPSLTVPMLFIGSHILPGYPFTGVDEAVQQALAEQAQAAKRAAQRAAQEKAERERRKNPTQFMEIIMEDEPSIKNTNASARDRRAMQRAIATVQQSNQQALNDIGTMFDNETQAAAFAITARTERLLKNKASDSPDYQTYASFEKRLLTLQERDLNQLMRQNAGKLKTIRG